MHQFCAFSSPKIDPAIYVISITGHFNCLEHTPYLLLPASLPRTQQKSRQHPEYIRPHLLLRAKVFLIAVRFGPAAVNLLTSQYNKSNTKQYLGGSSPVGNMIVACREGERLNYGILETILEDNLSG
ncbi:hypothetical protein [Gimesia sp.]|uniref:hypothetical protein n=1 Tax=Gimesia sp. TaxID=2024833 RepID=UPI0025C582B3|nr:hypothetical protein [Gimesia sp.]|tara:strand:+ start:49109 stop:49489 length:381 start_codon:yes stop_codon:yes gene_type:complete